MCTFFNYTNVFLENFTWAHFFAFFCLFFNSLVCLIFWIEKQHTFFLSTHTKIIVFYNLLTFVSKWATTTKLHLNLRFALVWLTAFFMWCIRKLDELFLLFSSLFFFFITTHSLVFGLSPFLSHFSNTPNNF